jgi:hypothetical protein
LWFEETTGEGVQGWREALAQLRMLRQLEEDHLFFDGLELHQFFDLIGGTSMGGVVAICLGRVSRSLPFIDPTSAWSSTAWARPTCSARTRFTYTDADAVFTLGAGVYDDRSGGSVGGRIGAGCGRTDFSEWRRC